MSQGFQTIIFPVRDVEKAKAHYTALLGVEPYMEQPYYVAYSVGGQDIGLDPNGHSHGMTGPLAYLHVDDIAKRLQALVDAGAEVLQQPKDVGGGKLLATVKDADGNVTGLIQPA
jgi:predicted enzyme related to lactoylglutathione lyase